MPEAIPLDGERRPARPAEAAVAAGAARATGERRRRKRSTTPLLAGLDSAGAAPDAADNGTRAADVVSAEEISLPETELPEAALPDQVLPDPVLPDTASAEPALPETVVPGTAEPEAAPTEPALPETDPAQGDRPGPVAKDAPAKTRKAATRRVGPASVPPATARAGRTRPAETPSARARRPGTRAAQPHPAQPGPTEAGKPVEDDRVAELIGAAAQAGGWLAEILASNLAPALAEQKVAAALEFLRRRLTGDYPVDEFGFDPELTDTVLLTLARPLYRRWFRVEVRGVENIPDTGGALVVANHSGAVALDSLMTLVAVHDEHPRHRHLRMLGADLVFQTAFLGWLARKGGATVASNADAERLLSAGELVGVWPEGFKGVGKPFSERYKLQRFGRGGFVSAALRTRTPIVPCAIVGAEETYPIIGNLPTLARLLGLPYLPITPTFPLLGPLGAVPLPSKWLIEFGTPLPTDTVASGAQDDPMLIFDLTDQVRQTIQQTLYTLLMQRRSIFF